MSIDCVGDHSDFSEFIAVCEFSLIGLMLSVRVLFEFAATIDMTPFF